MRAAGANRYETATAALCPDELACFRDTRHVVVATGAGFPDALAGSAVAAGLGAPLLLANPDEPAGSAFTTALFLLAPERGLILGGAGISMSSIRRSGSTSRRSNRSTAVRRTARITAKKAG